MGVPIITIFVRHSADCAHKKDESFKRCDCWKWLRWYDSIAKRQIRKPTKSRTWAGAEQARREQEAALDPTKPVSQEINQKHLIREIAQSFVNLKRGENISEGAIAKHTQGLNRLADFCEAKGLQFISDITTLHLADFRLTWPKFAPSANTRQGIQRRMKEFFRFCVGANLIEKDPSLALPRTAGEFVPTQPLEGDQYPNLLKAVNRLGEFHNRKPKNGGSHHTSAFPVGQVRAFIQCMRYSALSYGDTVQLKKSMLTKEHDGIWSVVTSRAKVKGSHVYVPIPDDVAREILDNALPTGEYCFWNKTTVPALETIKKYWRCELRRVFDYAGLHDCHSHQLRDTAAVGWLSDGIPMEEVSKMLGHSSIATTQRHYAPWVKSRQDRLKALVVATWSKHATHGARASRRSGES